jgi:hypothetical protein
MTDKMGLADLRQMAARCRRLVNSINDRPAEKALLNLASDCERKAAAMEREPAQAEPLLPA